MSYVTVTTADGQSMKAYEAFGDNKNAPGIVLIQEIFGVNIAMRQIADDWAARGYNVWCPDLFFRVEPGLELDPAIEAQLNLGLEIMEELDTDKALADLESTRAQLAQKLGHENIAGVGFCLGGRLVVQMAAQSPIKAAVSYYGVNLQNVVPPMGDTAPTLLHIAENDVWVPAEAREVIQAEAEKREGWESHVYADCDHAFARHNAEAAALAMQRSEAFIKRQL